MTDLFTNPHRLGDVDAWRREASESPARFTEICLQCHQLGLG
jgi:hypothetical protein